MPAPAAPLIGFLIGVAFAWAAADEVARAGQSTGTRSLALVALFGLVVFAPATGFFLAFSPDWSYAYVIDSQRLPGALDVLLVLIDAASVPAGFLIATPRAKRLSALIRLSIAPALLVAAFFAAAWPRLAVHASYAQFHGDFGVRPVSGSSLGYALLWM